jgi:hypothetical protein
MMADVNSEVVEAPGNSMSENESPSDRLQLTAHVSGSDFALVNNVEGRTCDVVCNGVKPGINMRKKLYMSIEIHTQDA